MKFIINMTTYHNNDIEKLASQAIAHVAKFLSGLTEKDTVASALKKIQEKEFQTSLSEALKDKIPKPHKLVDPDAPKRPPSGYLLFCENYRQEHKSELAEMAKNKESKKVMSRIAEAWSSAKKEEWNEKAAAGKEVYAQLKKNYEPKTKEELLALEVNQKTRKPRGKKDKDAPKNPRTKYACFQSLMTKKYKEKVDAKIEELKKENPKAGYPAAIAALWRKYEPQEKHKIMVAVRADHKADLARYEQEMAAYQNTEVQEKKDETDSEPEDEPEVEPIVVPKSPEKPKEKSKSKKNVTIVDPEATQVPESPKKTVKKSGKSKAKTPSPVSSPEDD